MRLLTLSSWMDLLGPVAALIPAITLAACMGPPFVTSEGAGSDGSTTTTVHASSSGGAGQGGGGSGDIDASGGRTSSTGVVVANGGAGDGGGAGGAAITESAILVVDAAHHPVVGATLVVNDALGAVITTSLSGADGKTTLAIPEGGSISVFASLGDATSVTTFVDVPVGAPVVLGVEVAPPPEPPAPPPTAFHLVVGFPQGATTFRCFSTCDSSSGTQEGQVCALSNAGCSGAPTEDILVVAYHDDKPVAWGQALAQATNPGGVVDLFVSATTVIPKAMVAITGIPVGASTGGVLVRGYASPRVSFGDKLLMAPPEGMLSGALAVPSGLAGGYEVTDTVTFAKPGSFDIVQRVRRYASLPAQSSFVASTPARATVDPLDLAGPGHPAVSWSVGGGATGDAVTVVVSWHEGMTSGSYIAYLPPDHVGLFRLPDAPPELAAFLPAAGSMFDAHGVGYVDDERVASYGSMLATVHGGAVANDGLGVITSFAWRAPVVP